jgi:hypothetical protein
MWRQLSKLASTTMAVRCPVGRHGVHTLSSGSSSATENRNSCSLVLWICRRRWCWGGGGTTACCETLLPKDRLLAFDEGSVGGGNSSGARGARALALSRHAALGRRGTHAYEGRRRRLAGLRRWLWWPMGSDGPRRAATGSGLRERTQPISIG